ncbi:MAG: glycosyltransferase [Candidatus Paceibacterota bacterium]|jgi:hypothetical protein
MKLSGYITTRNCVQMDYPFEATIRSLLDFCDEVVVGDSSDPEEGTLDILQKLMDEDDRVQVYHVEVPWDAPNYGIYDGQMKAYAREQCTGDYLWQMDCDEVCPADTRTKIEELLEKVGPKASLIALPVVEYWGSKEKIRVDVNPWKWRLSKNDPNITHGIPAQLRWEKDGLLYARHGTDGCDYIYADTGEIVPCVHFMRPEVEDVRRKASTEDEAANMYRFWLQTVIEQLPTVYHFSWWSIAAKIRKYKHFWNNSWLTLYGEKQDKPEGWNPFFDRPLSEVSDEEINITAKKIATETGGHIFHSPWTGQKTKHISLEHELPEVIREWAATHRDF